MAARLLKHHQDSVRDKIRASYLVNRLQDHFAGKIELTPSQIRAAEILLDRCVPKMSAIEHTGEVTHNYVARVPEIAASTEDWMQNHVPPEVRTH